jgi:mannan endo-1,4-beta-mannosidase
MSTETKRQNADDQCVGSAFDGSQGVDSEDIINIPQIGFGTFQLFPDQNSYGVPDPNLPAFNNTVNLGLSWITRQAGIGQLFGKPVALTGFGLVTTDNAPSFVPFNETQAPFGPDSGSNQTQQPFGVTNTQQNDAYTQWLNTGLQSGLAGMVQYQWSQGNLTTAVGTAISPTVSGTSVSPDVTGTGVSPNDGYSINGQEFDPIASTIQQAAQAFGADTN